MSAQAPTSQRHAHASGLHAVAAALDSLHRDVVRTAGAEFSQVRLSVMNMVAACNDQTLVDDVIETLLGVAEHHPARLIVLLADRHGDAKLESDISLQLAEDSSYLELVRLEVRGEPALHLASIVQPLLVPDIPVLLWLVGAPPLEQAFRTDAVQLCDRLILDTAAYPDTASTLQRVSDELHHHGADLVISDISWRRLHPWREAIAQAFDGQSVRPWLARIRGVDIVSNGANSAVESWLLAGWLSSRLRWDESATPQVTLSSVPRASTHGPELSRVRIRCGDGRHTARVHVERRGHVLHTAIDIDAGVVATHATTLPHWDTGMLISRLMADVVDDHVYRGAVTEAARLALRGE